MQGKARELSFRNEPLSFIPLDGLEQKPEWKTTLTRHEGRGVLDYGKDLDLVSGKS